MRGLDKVSVSGLASFPKRLRESILIYGSSDILVGIHEDRVKFPPLRKGG
jgi:hypothetical protein